MKKFYLNTSKATEKEAKQCFILPSFVGDTEEAQQAFIEDVQLAYDVLHVGDMKTILSSIDGQLAGLLNIDDPDWSFSEEVDHYTADYLKKLEDGTEAQKKLAGLAKAWISANAEYLAFDAKTAGQEATKLATAFIIGMKLTRASVKAPTKLSSLVEAVKACNDAIDSKGTYTKEQEKTARQEIATFYSELLTDAGHTGIQKISHSWFADVLRITAEQITAKKSRLDSKTGTYSIAGFQRKTPKDSAVFIGLCNALFYHYGKVQAGEKQQGRKQYKNEIQF